MQVNALFFGGRGCRVCEEAQGICWQSQLDREDQLQFARLQARKFGAKTEAIGAGQRCFRRRWPREARLPAQLQQAKGPMQRRPNVARQPNER